MENTDLVVSELLSELKAGNARKEQRLYRLNQTLIITIILAMITILLTVAGFLWYLSQYDFTSYETITAEGVYALVDSEGNVIASDLTADEIKQIVGGLTDNG